MNRLLNANALLKFRASLATNYLVAQETQAQVSGFAFSVDRTTQMEAKADITDYYVEDNTAVNDFIAIKPLRITLSGYVGEKTYTRPTFSNQFLQGLPEKLTIVASLFPKWTNYTQQILENMALQAAQTQAILSKIDSLYSVANLSSAQMTRQQAGYQFFENILRNKQLVTVVTPYNAYRNMAIEALSATQGEGSKMISDFSVTFKQVQTVSTKYELFDAQKNMSYRQQQDSTTVNNGNATQDVDLPK